LLKKGREIYPDRKNCEPSSIAFQLVPLCCYQRISFCDACNVDVGILLNNSALFYDNYNDDNDDNDDNDNNDNDNNDNNVITCIYYISGHFLLLLSN